MVFIDVIINGTVTAEVMCTLLGNLFLAVYRQCFRNMWVAVFCLIAVGANFDLIL